MVAHRGASSTHAENTLSALEAAVAAGAQAVELDVRLTADGVPVVIHDPDVSRVSEGEGLVAEMTFQQVRALDVSRGLHGPAEVPSLSEVLAALSGRAAAVIEIKNWPQQPGFDPDHGQVEAVIRELDDAGFSGPVLLASFNWASVDRARVLAPGMPTGLLSVSGVADPGLALERAGEGGHAFVLPHVSDLVAEGPAFVGSAHEAGVRVGTWVVDEENAVRTLFSWGVDAVATDDPAMAVALRPGGQG
ncbi:MAG: glycerophosphodiester phosphodiesterase [Actinomycetota bacterium]